MPRSFSSGALSMSSTARFWMLECSVARQLMIAAVSVVLPWSTCPVVPMLTCGFDRSNFAFAMMPFSRCPSYCAWCVVEALRSASPLGGREFLSLSLGDDLFLDGLRRLLVVRELHG